ncbi:MAG: hypothetical protein J6A21_00210 [Lentisphaeria bacterium]|nr:hypothetical protein [Lentisphaeria bacterium]
MRKRKFFSGVFRSAFLFFALLAFLPCKGEEKHVFEKDFSEQLPGVIPPFRKAGIRRTSDGAKVLYQAPSGVMFQVQCGNASMKILSDDPSSGENPKIMEKLFAQFRDTLKKNSAGTAGKNARAETVFSRPLSLPALAMKNVRGVWRKFRVLSDKGKDVLHADCFIAFYRGNFFRIEFLSPPGRSGSAGDLPEKLFRRITSSVCALLYSGEKIRVAEHLKTLVLRDFEKLMKDPLHAVEEARALTSFVDRSPLVFVRVDDGDFVWHQSLAKGTPKEQTYAFLLLSSFMAGNAVSQIRTGICSDRREDGLLAMKKVYALLKKEDKLLSIPELEK